MYRYLYACNCMRYMGYMGRLLSEKYSGIQEIGQDERQNFYLG